MSRWLSGLVLVGCVHQAPTKLDPTLPEDLHEVALQEPLEVLTSAAASMDPSPRARALVLLVREDPQAWAPRGLADPVDWVQRSVVMELLRLRGAGPEVDLLLKDYAQGRGAPYVRCLVAEALPKGEVMEGFTGWPEESAPWVVAPLAFGALEQGDAAALGPLGEALSTGELPLDVDFVLALGRSGETALAPALERAQGVVEQELVLPLATARRLLGDAGGEHALRQATGDQDVQRRLEVVDYALELSSEQAAPLLKRAKNQGPELVSSYAAMALEVQAQGPIDTVVHAMEAADPERRRLAVSMASWVLKEAPGVKRGARQAREVLLTGLSDPDTAVQVAALRACGELHLANAEALAQRALIHEVLEVRVEAAGCALSQ